MNGAARTEIEIAGDLTPFRNDLKTAEGLATSSGKTIGQKFSDVGSTLTKTLTPAALAIGALFKKAFDEWDTGFDAIRVATGATGKELEKLGASMKRVGGQVTQPLSEVGKVMGDLATRTGLTGRPLEHLTKQILDLARITGTDAQASVAGITRVFGDWGVKTRDQSKTLDMLFRASQSTGVGVDTLAAQLVQFGAPLRQMGFGLGETAALLGKFEKEGVNTELVMGSLRIALGKMAREGIEDPKQALTEITRRIKEAGSAGKANAIALEFFGARAGPDMAAAIREGRFELGSLFKEVTKGKETIKAATADTTDYGDKFAMLRNKVFGVIGPFGEFGSMIAGGVAAIGPFLMGMGALISSFQAGGVAATVLNAALTALPWIAIAAAVIALAVVIIKNWDSIKEFLLKAWEAIKGAATAIWNGIKSALSAIWNGIKAAATTTFNALKMYFTTVSNIYKTVFTTAWNAIKTAVAAIWNAIKLAASTVFNAIKGYFTNVLNAYKTLFTNIWNAIKTAVVAIWNGLKTAASTAFNAIKTFLTNVLNAYKNLFTTAWNAIKAVVTTVFNAIKSVVSTAGNAIRGVVQDFLNGVKNLFTNIWNGLKSIVTGAWNAIKKAVSEGASGVLELIRSIPGRILSALGNLGSLLYDAGRSIITGLLNGIKSALTAVWNEVSAIAGKIKSLKGPLDYDRRLLVPAGEAIMTGLVAGIDAEMSSLKSKLADVTDMLRVEGRVSVRGPSMAPAGAGAGLASSGPTTILHINGLTIDNAPQEVIDFFSGLRQGVRQGVGSGS